MEFDHVSDLHVDNAMIGGPHNIRLDWAKMVRPDGIADGVIIAGDTAEHRADTMLVMNDALQVYPRVIGCYGNHDIIGQPCDGMAHVGMLECAPARVGDVLFVGGLYLSLSMIEQIRAAQSDTSLRAIALVTHLPAVPGLHAKINVPPEWYASKADTQFWDALIVADRKEIVTTHIFGHLHVEVDTYVTAGHRSIHCVSNPRGYKQTRRDGSGFSGMRRITI